jgi:ParB-like chromosome segregation protein Spo0J
MIYAAHSIANLFPMMLDEEFEALKADIKKHGLRDPITIYENKILDGRNRYKACLELKIEPDVVVVERENPWDFVKSKNISRRHLSESQRAAIGAELVLGSKDWVEKHARLQAEANEKRRESMKGRRNASKDKDKNSDPPRGGSLSEQPKKARAAVEVAEKAKVGVTTAERAIRVMKNAPDLHEKVKKGEMKVATANNEVKRRKAHIENGDSGNTNGNGNSIYEKYTGKAAIIRITDRHVDLIELTDNPKTTKALTWDKVLARLLISRLRKLVR